MTRTVTPVDLRLSRRVAAEASAPPTWLKRKVLRELRTLRASECGDLCGILPTTPKWVLRVSQFLISKRFHPDYKPVHRSPLCASLP